LFRFICRGSLGYKIFVRGFSTGR